MKRPTPPAFEREGWDIKWYPVKFGLIRMPVSILIFVSVRPIIEKGKPKLHRV